jgi:hypothetical protein
MGSFLLLNPLKRTFVPNVNASISSVAVAKAKPFLTISAH